MASKVTLCCLSLVALQGGVQPFLAKSCIPTGTPMSSVVLGTELIKTVLCLVFLCLDSAGRQALRCWSLRSALVAAGLPSVTYVVQNFCIQLAYQKLDGVAFSVLNQLKVLSTALFAYLFAGRRQSGVQCVALVLVTLAAMLASMPAEGSTPSTRGSLQDNMSLGVPLALAGAALSGLGSGFTEWALNHKNRHAFLLSLELSVLGSVVVLVSLVLGLNADGEVWRAEGLYARWRLSTLVPVCSQGAGGLLVGLITKHVGGVQKILATICGLLLTCLLRQLLHGGLPPVPVCLSIPLVALGIYLHASNPPRSKKELHSE